MRVIVFLIIFCLILNFCFADEQSVLQLKEEIQRLKEIISSYEEKLNKLEEQVMQKTQKAPQITEADLSNLNKYIDEQLNERFSGFEFLKDLELGIGSTVVVQATNNANMDEAVKEDVAEASYSIDLEFLKKFKDYGKAFIHLEEGNGNGVEPHLKVFSNVNRDADDDNNVRATEVWYEHNFSKDGSTLAVMFGKLDPTIFVDDNAYANDENSQFLGRIFRNSPTIEFPDNSAGIKLFYNLKERVEFTILGLDGNADWENTFDGMFFAAQVNFKQFIFSKEGNYRFYGWYNNQPHTYWNDPTKDKEKSFGFGLSFDQQINKILGLFCRYGWQNSKVYLNTSPDFSLKQAYSIGLQLEGSLWKRPQDKIGLAFGQIFPSSYYKDADSQNPKKGESEKHLEFYYNIYINEHLSLTVDIQNIWSAYGSDTDIDDSLITVGGLRARIEF